MPGVQEGSCNAKCTRHRRNAGHAELVTDKCGATTFLLFLDCRLRHPASCFCCYAAVCVLPNNTMALCRLSPTHKAMHNFACHNAVFCMHTLALLTRLLTVMAKTDSLG